MVRNVYDGDDADIDAPECEGGRDSMVSKASDQMELRVSRYGPQQPTGSGDVPQ